MLEDHHVAKRIAARMARRRPAAPGRHRGPGPAGRLQPVLGPLDAGSCEARSSDAVASVGVQKTFARNAADGPGRRRQQHTAVDLAAAPIRRPSPWSAIVRTAAIIVVAAVSGMRSSELMELRVGCRRPVEEPVPGLQRYRLASKIVKGQPLGGTDDEWVVIEPVYRAVELAEQLHDNPRDGAPLFGRFAFNVRYTWFRNWVNAPAGQRLGLAPIPDGPVNLRMLRRTLALELAYRPGGVLAAKIHLKHVAVATTEGYASRPGGAQAELLAEVNKHESRPQPRAWSWPSSATTSRASCPPAPAPASLTEFFASIDAEPRRSPRGSAEDPAQRPRHPQPADQARQRPAPRARRTTAGSPTRPAHSASSSPAPRPPTGR